MFNTHLKKRLESKEEELFKLHQLFHGMTAEMVSLVLDPQFRIIDFNQRFLDLLGYTAEQVRDMSTSRHKAEQGARWGGLPIN